MTTQQLLKELKIRFNTDPKRYEKPDFLILLKLLESLINEKLDKLVSGTNIKTINEQSILGEGNINITNEES